jgi:ATP-binding cassette, subfamily B, bacterial
VRRPWRRQGGAANKSLPDSTEAIAANEGPPDSPEGRAADATPAEPAEIDGGLPEGEEREATEALPPAPGSDGQRPIKRSLWQRSRRRARRIRRAPRRMVRRVFRAFRRLLKTVFIRAPRRFFKGLRRLIKAPGRRFRARRKEKARQRREKARRKKKKRKKSAWANWKIMPRIWPYMKPYRGLAVMTLILTVLAAAIALAEPWPLAIVLDSVLGDKSPPSILHPLFGSNPDPYDLLIFIVAIGFAITVLTQGVQVITQYVSVKLEENMILGFRSHLFEHCQRLSLTFHDSEHTGRLMSRINIQAGTVGQIPMAFPPLLQAALTLIGMLVIAVLIDWQVTLVSMVAVPLIYYAIGLYGTRIVPQISSVMGLEWRSLSIVYEAMAMLRVIVSFGRERYEHRRFSQQGQTSVDARVRLTVKQTMFNLGVATAIGAGTALVLGFGAWHVLRGDITIGEMTVLIAYIASVYQPLEQISVTIGNLHEQFVFLNASFKLLDQEPEVNEAPDAIDPGPLRGDITFDNVSFAYEGRDDTLKGISFDAKAGQRIALVGPTGAGKTTLVNLLVRFYEPKDGRILIDGIDIRRLTLKSLREQIGLVLQEPMLFSGTIASNIRYGHLDASTEDIVAAAKAANAHDFISRLPDGYETELGERGAQLSTGERQRIAVARTMIKDAPILVLDEPTASIDSKTESVILDALDEMMVGRTSLMIAHRLSTIRDADLILVMEDGQLVEKGTHEELVEQDGLYSQLFYAQERRRERKRLDAERRAREEEAGKPAETAAETAVAQGAETEVNGHRPAEGARVDGEAGEQPQDGEGRELQDELIESLAQAMRRRVRTALRESDGEQDKQ